MKYFIIPLVAVMVGCGADKLKEKPFIIIDKESSTCGCRMAYTYQDKSGSTETFYDSANYQIGDTIK